MAGSVEAHRLPRRKHPALAYIALGLPPSLAAFVGAMPYLLHCPAAPAAEVVAWVNTGLDIYYIETLIAGSGEFFTNG